MRQVRQGVFETNSSSVHTITICSDEEYNAWTKGELLVNDYDGEFKHKDDINQFSEDFKSYTSYMSSLYDLEYYHTTYTTKGGEKIHVFGRTGYDG